jgi:hypothetical protein
VLCWVEQTHSGVFDHGGIPRFGPRRNPGMSFSSAGIACIVAAVHHI